MILVSGNQNSLGQIMQTNNEFLHLLGQTKAKVDNQNINHFMPKVIGEAHNSLMQGYLEKDNDDIRTFNN